MAGDRRGAGALRVERLGPDQWGRLRAVRLAALRDSPDAFFDTYARAEARTPDDWRAQLGRADAASFLAVLDDQDVGLAWGAPHHEDPADAGLYAMWVRPAARGRGAGDALVEAVIAWARDAGYRRIRLDVGDHNAAAIRLYARRGFEPTGVTSTFPPPRQHVVEHERARCVDERS